MCGGAIPLNDTTERLTCQCGTLQLDSFLFFFFLLFFACVRLLWGIVLDLLPAFRCQSTASQINMHPNVSVIDRGSCPPLSAQFNYSPRLRLRFSDAQHCACIIRHPHPGGDTFPSTVMSTSFVLTDDFSTTVLSQDIYTDSSVCFRNLILFFSL